MTASMRHGRGWGGGGVGAPATFWRFLRFWGATRTPHPSPFAPPPQSKNKQNIPVILRKLFRLGGLLGSNLFWRVEVPRVREKNTGIGQIVSSWYDIFLLVSLCFGLLLHTWNSSTREFRLKKKSSKSVVFRDDILSYFAMRGGAEKIQRHQSRR